MGIFEYLKKKEAGTGSKLVTSSIDTLPPPPDLVDAEMPKMKEESKLRFPTLPKKENWKAIKNFEDKAYRQEKRNVEQREVLDVIQPLFVKGAQYREMDISVNETKLALKRADVFADKFQEINVLKEEKFEELKSHIETIQRKMIFMDKTLFK